VARRSVGGPDGPAVQFAELELVAEDTRYASGSLAKLHADRTEVSAPTGYAGDGGIPGTLP